jgi:anti-sigma factor RsiW
MKCPEIAELSSLYLAGELEAPSSREFENHLRACPACGRELEEQRMLDDALRAAILAGEVDTTGVDNQVRQQIAFPQAPAAQPNRFRAPQARWLATAGVAASITLAFLVYRVTFRTQIATVYADAARHHGHLVDHKQWISGQGPLAQLAQQGGMEASALMSLAPAGYRLEHGKLCRLDGRPFLHLVYTNGVNEVSVFLRPWDDPEPSQGIAMGTVNNSVLYTVDIGPEHLSFFQTRQLTAVVVSDQSDGKTALSVASSIARAL